MNLLLLLLAITALHNGAIATDSKFSKTANDAHEQCLNLHLLMETHFDSVRVNASRQFAEASEKSLTHILNGIKQAESKLLSLLKLANYARASACSQAASKRLLEQIHATGLTISTCSSTADLSIQRLADKFFDSLEAPQAAAIDVLNLVLTYFGNWNPSEENVMADVSVALNDIIEQFRQTFLLETLPTLRNQLEIVHQGTIEIPMETEMCIKTVVTQLDQINSSVGGLTSLNC